MDNNVEEIVVDKELFDYIRGEGRYKNIRPDVDYTRWFHISKYLTENKKPHIKNEIIRLLLELLDSNDWYDQYAVAGICLNIDTPEIDKKFEQNVLKPSFFSFPEAFVSFASKYVMKKRLRSVEKLVVENAIKKDRVDWIITLISSNADEQEDYWKYCDKIIGDILPKMNESEKFQIYEKVSIWKNKIMLVINN